MLNKTAMRDAFYNHAGYTVTQIGPEDWQAYRAFYTELKTPQHHARTFHEGIDKMAQSTYATLFESIARHNGVIFGLWHHGQIVGVTELYFTNFEGQSAVEFAASEIADSYRGNWLSIPLYKARTRYLKNRGFEDLQIAFIKSDNKVSQIAAQNNCFVDTKKCEGPFKIFTRHCR